MYDGAPERLFYTKRTYYKCCDCGAYILPDETITITMLSADCKRSIGVGRMCYACALDAEIITDEQFNEIYGI